MVAVLAAASALAWAVFCAWYALRARWERTPEGKNTMAVSVLLALIFVRMSALAARPDLAADLAVAGALASVLGVVLAVHRIVLLERAQSERDRH